MLSESLSPLGRVGGLYLEDHISLLYEISVFEIRSEHYIVLETVIYHLHNLESGNHALLLCRHGGDSVHRLGYDGFCGDVTCVDVFFYAQIEQFGDKVFVLHILKIIIS